MRPKLEELSSFIASAPPSAGVINYLIARNQQEALSTEKAWALKALKSGTPRFVVTGQQVGLFGGPLLTLYKAVSAVKLARELSSKDSPVVPVFWIQSEDHDLEEVREATIWVGGEARSFAAFQASENRKSLSEITLPANTPELISLLCEALNGEESLKTLLAKSYQVGSSMSAAFRALYSELFKDTPLLFIDPRDELFQSFCSTEWKEAIGKSLFLRRDIEAALTQSTAIETVKVRTGSPLFFLSDNNGERYRLSESVPGKFDSDNRRDSYTESELANILQVQPERFTTSALLRPVVQDQLLKSIAYIGGDAELSYHLQLDSVYSLLGLTAPALVGRAKFLVVDEKIEKLLKLLNLKNSSELSIPESEIPQKLKLLGLITKKTRSEIELLVGPKLDEIISIVESEIFEPTLQRPLEKTKESIKFSLSQFLGKYEAALLKSDEILMERVERLRNYLRPKGIEQERTLSLPWLLHKIGEGLENLVVKAELDSPRVDLYLSEINKAGE